MSEFRTWFAENALRLSVGLLVALVSFVWTTMLGDIRGEAREQNLKLDRQSERIEQMLIWQGRQENQVARTEADVRENAARIREIERTVWGAVKPQPAQ